jgi:hypothetical protein
MNEDGKGFKISRMGEVQEGRLIDTVQMKYADTRGSRVFSRISISVLFERCRNMPLSPPITRLTRLTQALYRARAAARDDVTRKLRCLSRWLLFAFQF